ncbi:hypothetical protein D3C71_1017890 [compost metagenome]
MALKLNSQPSEPSGPLRESTRYTTSPTTTDGTASKVLSTASTAPRPAKRATPSQAPSTRPTPQAIRHAVALTDKERPTMVHRTGSEERVSCSAVFALSESVDMGSAIVGTSPISSDMNVRA